MKYTADCPECLAEFEVPGPITASRGIQCISCGHKFTPEKIHRVHPTEEEKENQRLDGLRYKEKEEFDKLKSRAEICSLIAVLAAGIGVLVVIIGFNATSETGQISAGIYWGVGLFSLAIALFFFAQLFHIRAALQKLFTKE